MKLPLNIAVVGATGAVGTMMLNILAQRNFPVQEVYALASARSKGKTVHFKDKVLTVEDIADFDFSKTQIALFSAGSSVSAEYGIKAANAGCIVIDNTSHFRYEPHIPLVIAEVNPHALKKCFIPTAFQAATRRERSRGAECTNKYMSTETSYDNLVPAEAGKSRSLKGEGYIIANPNCSTMQMLVALKPLHDKAKIRRINVATYQSVSGTGQSAIEELLKQSKQVLSGEKISCEVYPHPIAFNVLPHIDAFEQNGYTREEMKMVWETQKILEDDQILVNPTAVRVPVVYGHAEAVHIETEHKLTAEEARDILTNAPGVCVVDDPAHKIYPTPVTHAAGQDPVFVGRIREDISHPRGLNLWIVADNIRKGAALNAVQIAEILIEDNFSSLGAKRSNPVF